MEDISWMSRHYITNVTPAPKLINKPDGTSIKISTVLLVTIDKSIPECLWSGEGIEQF